MFTAAKTRMKFESGSRGDFMNEQTTPLLSEPACRLHYVKKIVLFR